MHWFYILIVISSGYGPLTKGSSVAPSSVFREKPSILSVTAFDGRFEVAWTAVEKVNEEAVLGYKLYVWELEDEKTKHYVDNDGKIVLVNEEIKPAEVDLYKLPTVEPTVIDVPVGTTRYNYGPLKSNVTYEMRVAAYGATGEGLMSDAVILR